MKCLATKGREVGSKVIFWLGDWGWEGKGCYE